MGFIPGESSAAGMKETTSLTLKESAAFLGGNDYLRDVAILVIAYGTSINIVEGGWCTCLLLSRLTGRRGW